MPLSCILYDAFGIQVLYRHHLNQVTIYATITDTTPATLTAIISDNDTPGHATTTPTATTPSTPAGLSDLSPSPIRLR